MTLSGEEMTSVSSSGMGIGGHRSIEARLCSRGVPSSVWGEVGTVINAVKRKHQDCANPEGEL